MPAKQALNKSSESRPYIENFNDTYRGNTGPCKVRLGTFNF